MKMRKAKHKKPRIKVILIRGKVSQESMWKLLEKQLKHPTK